MATTDLRETLGRWRKASTNNDDEKRSKISSNLRLLIVCGGSLWLLLFFFLGIRHVNAPSQESDTASEDAGLLGDVFNSTLGFQKIFVVNLPKRTDRRDSMSLAAAFSNLQMEYVDGVTEVDDEALPPGGKEKDFKDSVVGAWRAHMNAIRMIVEQNLTSALILEDDADWDVRIKSQMRDFAKATRLLIQPLPGTTDQFLDPTHDGHYWQGHSDFDVRKEVTSEPTTSPYGDVHLWDMLWIGHCGTDFPRRSDTDTPLGRAVLLDDETVPEPQHLDFQAAGNELMNEYPPHTRVVHRTHGTICSLAYAVSQRGARTILWELGVNRLNMSYDNSLRSICNGKNNRKHRTCFSVQPQLFQHHRPRGDKSTFSDISGFGGFNEQPFTKNVRWSTRVNFAKLVDGTTDYIDLFKDGEEANPAFGHG